MGAHAAQGLDTCPGGDAPSGDASALRVTQRRKKTGSPYPTDTCACTLGCPVRGRAQSTVFLSQASRSGVTSPANGRAARGRGVGDWGCGPP